MCPPATGLFRARHGFPCLGPRIIPAIFEGSPERSRQDEQRLAFQVRLPQLLDSAPFGHTGGLIQLIVRPKKVIGLQFQRRDSFERERRDGSPEWHLGG